MKLSGDKVLVKKLSEDNTLLYVAVIEYNTLPSKSVIKDPSKFRNGSYLSPRLTKGDPVVNVAVIVLYIIYPFLNTCIQCLADSGKLSDTTIELSVLSIVYHVLPCDAGIVSMYSSLSPLINTSTILLIASAS